MGMRKIMKLKQLNEIGHWAVPKKGERMSPLLYPNQTQEFINWGKKEKPKKKKTKKQS
jgi:hypothetical protein